MPRRLPCNQNNAVLMYFFRNGNDFVVTAGYAVIGVIPIKKVACLDKIIFAHCLINFDCYYFPLFGLFATAGIYFSAIKKEAGAILQG